MSRLSIRGAGERALLTLIGVLLVVGFLALLLWHAVFIAILPGHVGVLYSLLFRGTVVDYVYHEGLAVKWPWNRMYIVDVRTQSMPLKVKVLSAEGMTSTFEITALYHPRRDKAPRLVKEIGLNYEEKVVAPLVTRAVRDAVGGFDSTELFSIDRESLQKSILSTVRDSAQAELIDFQNILIKRIELPKVLSDAIIEKLSQEQLAQSYVFRLQAQRLEAQRLGIEAEGLQNFYAIVGESLTSQLLTWRGIEATVSLAKSPNTKIVIVGSGKDQLPLILGSDIHKLPAQAGETAPDGEGSIDPAESGAISPEAPAQSRNILVDPIVPGTPKPIVKPLAPSTDPAEIGR